MRFSIPVFIRCTELGLLGSPFLYLTRTRKLVYHESGPYIPAVAKQLPLHFYRCFIAAGLVQPRPNRLYHCRPPAGVL